MIQASCRPICRRSLLSSYSAGIALAAASPGLFCSAPAFSLGTDSIMLGIGQHTYEWVSGWAKLPEGLHFGNTHGAVVIDSRGRVYMNTDTENAVIVFSAEGTYINSFGKEWKGGLHGMTLHKEGSEEFIYLTHHTRHEFGKMTLNGEVVWVRGYPEQSGIYKTADEFRPTGVAVAPNGDLYVTDGYGLSWVHHYNSRADYIRSWGGPAGSDPGKLRQPHGIWMDTRGAQPLVLVADRANHRLQWFSLGGEYVKTVADDLRLPSNFDQRGTDLVVADLAGRVTILDKNNRLVTHLGDNPEPEQRGQNPLPPEKWRDGVFISPHCPRWDTDGNLYVAEWLSNGRIDKLKRVRRTTP